MAAPSGDDFAARSKPPVRKVELAAARRATIDNVRSRSYVGFEFHVQRSRAPEIESHAAARHTSGTAGGEARLARMVPARCSLDRLLHLAAVFDRGRDVPFISYTAFFKSLDEQQIENVTLKGQTVTGKFKGEAKIEGQTLKHFRTMVPAQEDPTLIPKLREQGVTVSVRSEEQPLGLQILLSLLPFALIVGAWVWLSRRAQSMMGPGGPLGGVLKGKSRRFEKEGQVPVRFEDVAGLRSAKQDLQEIVQFLKEPERFRRLGGKVPRGVLLVGLPARGRRCSRRAVAGEAGVPFFSINGSEFIELFVGVGASRVRELFEEAKKVAPAIIFIDEIDAVGRSRGAGLGGGHDEREQTLNQLLSEMDGFSRNDLTIVLAATNRPDVLDAALLRPGRFDRRVIIDRPELGARKAILEVHTRGKPLESDVDLNVIAGNTPGFSGADLANLVNEAALNATRRGADAIASSDFSDGLRQDRARRSARDQARSGRKAARRGARGRTRRRGALLAERGAAERVTIIPRGMALGVTQQQPGADRHLDTEPQLVDSLRMLLGGYAAEQVMLSSISSGAENDLEAGHRARVQDGRALGHEQEGRPACTRAPDGASVPRSDARDGGRHQRRYRAHHRGRDGHDPLAVDGRVQAHHHRAPRGRWSA